MNLGVCYFPEHWPRDQWERDVERMAEAGIRYVRMGEFAWTSLEPEPGEFDFEWLETVVDMLDDRDMEAVLCTPTATPPKWLVDEHPDILQEEADGTVRRFGGRRHYCFNSETYREETERIVRGLTEQFADHPAVAGWQTDNEYGCHGTLRCYCDDCAAAFREWLEEKYGDIETLNESWGNAFWSQDYTGFDEIDPPRHTAAGHHPSRLLDYYRFSSDSACEYNRLQADLIREANDDWFVTHNFMSYFDPLDARSMSQDLDFASWDSYPTGHVQHQKGASTTGTELRVGDPNGTGFNHDLYRSVSDAPPWVMEQQPGGVNWPPYPEQPAEGAMRLWAHHAVAHGVDVVSYFRWRRCRMGQEQYHAGLCKQSGDPDRGYRDAARVAEELADVADNLDGADGDVAVLHDYENAWATEIEPVSPDFDYWSHLTAYYRALRERGVAVDVVHPREELTGYDAVIAPTLYLVGDDTATNLTDYVEGGGELLVTIRSGIKDRFDKLHEADQPGPLTDLVGARVDQYEGLRDAARVSYRGETYDYGTWAEWLAPEGGDVVGTHESGVAADRAAIVRNERGDGSATYVGVHPGPDLAGATVENLLDRAGVKRSEPLPEGVRTARRDGRTWVMNFGGESVTVDGPADAEWLLGGPSVAPTDVSVTDAAPADLSVRRADSP